MTQIDLAIPAGDVVAQIESHAATLGLAVMKTGLRTYPGSIHWHFTRPGSSGTLECTWHPAGNRLWLAVHSNRVAGWQDEVIQAFLREFAH